MNIVITGANRGIGLAICTQYLDQGHTVYAACREATAELNALNVNIIEGIDVTSNDSLTTLKAALSGITIDILINNAGILHAEGLADVHANTMEQQYAVNALAPLRVTEALLDNLGKGSKVAMITSRMGSIEDNGSGSYYGYRMSKAALNAGAKSLAIDLQPQGIAVALLHPGMVSTRMIGFHGDVTPEQSAAGLLARIEELTLANSGTFWHAQGEVLPW